MQNQKWQHPFFLGLVVIFLSFFFTVVRITPKAPLGNDDPGISVSLRFSMWDMAWGNDVKMKMNTFRELDSYSRRELAKVNRILSVPRVAGVYFTIILMLMAWGFITFAAYDSMRTTNIKAICCGIAGVFLLFLLVVCYEVWHYRSIINERDNGSYGLNDVVAIKPHIGLVFFIAGNILLFLGAFSNWRPNLKLKAYPPGNHPV
jgi:hypothetical protein